jgi:hypothetical protein
MSDETLEAEHHQAPQTLPVVPVQAEGQDLSGGHQGVDFTVVMSTGTNAVVQLLGRDYDRLECRWTSRSSSRRPRRWPRARRTPPTRPDCPPSAPCCPSAWIACGATAMRCGPPPPRPRPRGYRSSCPAGCPLPAQLSLNAEASVVLDANGDGTAQCGPSLPGTSWQPTNIAVSVATNASEAQCNLYLGLSAAAGSLLGATSTGSTGDSTDCSQTVWPGQSLIAVWAGGDPGSIATLSVFGTKTVPGGG